MTDQILFLWIIRLFSKVLTHEVKSVKISWEQMYTVGTFNDEGKVELEVEFFVMGLVVPHKPRSRHLRSASANNASLLRFKEKEVCPVIGNQPQV
ncbi:hypothetical protein HI914_06373 [Erysiphe necator]|nr:hypothetical protein HI914_06373 [Erysiphe necator]